MGRNKVIEDEDLLASAREAFVELGFGVPTRVLAQRTGLSEGALFKRFTTKEALFFAAMTVPAADVDAIFAHAASATGARECLEEIALGILDYFRAVMPTLLRLTMHPNFDMGNHSTRDSSIVERRLHARLIEHISAEQSAGRIRTDDPQSSAGMLIAALHSLALFEVMGIHGGRMEEPAVRAMVRSLWYGLAPASGSRASPEANPGSGGRE